MCSSSLIVSRLNKIHKELEILSKLQKIEDSVFEGVDNMHNSKEKHVESKNTTEIVKPSLSKYKNKSISHQTKHMKCNFAGDDSRNKFKDTDKVTEISDKLNEALNRDNVLQEKNSKQDSVNVICKSVNNENATSENRNASLNTDLSRTNKDRALYRKEENMDIMQSNANVLIRNDTNDSTGFHTVPKENKESKQHDKNPDKNSKGNSNKNTTECPRKKISNEWRSRTDLEKELENLRYKLKILQEKEEQQDARLKDALIIAEEQMKLVEKLKSREINLVQQCDLLRLSKDDVLNQVSRLKKEMNEIVCKNAKLNSQCDELQRELNEVIETGKIKSIESTAELDKIRCTMEKQEDNMKNEKRKYEEIISHLANVIKVQKKRECELTNLINKQRIVLEQKDRFLAEKEEKLLSIDVDLKSASNENVQMNAEIQELTKSLGDTMNVNEKLKKEIKDCKENYIYELKIKDTIIADKNDTINKQKKLLQDSEKLASQVAHELEKLHVEMRLEKETNYSLKTELEIARKQLTNENLMQCRKCIVLESKIECMTEQKERALLTAKYTAEKLHRCSQEFQKQTESNKKHYKFMMTVLKEKDETIQNLKKKLSSFSNEVELENHN